MKAANKYLFPASASVLIGCLLPPTESQAQDIGLNVWGMEFATLSQGELDHMALYPGVSLSLTYETLGWALSPSLGVEWAADGEFWGLMGMLYADRPINDDLGFDVILAGMHDQVGTEWSNAEFFVGAGPGLSWFVNNRVTLTPNVLAYYGVKTQTWALAPGINLWVSLESE